MLNQVIMVICSVATLKLKILNISLIITTAICTSFAWSNIPEEYYKKLLANQGMVNPFHSPSLSLQILSEA